MDIFRGKSCPTKKGKKNMSREIYNASIEGIVGILIKSRTMLVYAETILIFEDIGDITDAIDTIKKFREGCPAEEKALIDRCLAEKNVKELMDFVRSKREREQRLIAKSIEILKREGFQVEE